LNARVQFALSAAAVLFFSRAVPAQQMAGPSTLTLQRAVQIALEKNPLRKAALANTQAATADVLQARSALMPRLTFSEMAMRGDDPVYVFGSKLRQQRFTTADFALNRLNRPLPFGNFATRFGGTWNLFDSFANWHEISRAKHMNEAAGYELEHTDQEIVFRVVKVYYEVLLAGKQLEVAEQAAKTTQAITSRSQTRFDAGVVVESDLLTAKVRQAAREQELIRARNNLSLAGAELNTVMGVSLQAPFNPAEALGERDLPQPVLAEVEKTALAHRPDLRMIQSEQAAQNQSVSIAKSSFGPRINAFAGWELDNPTFIAGGERQRTLGGPPRVLRSGRQP